MIGIYKITSKINNRVYIGKSLDVVNRIRYHFDSLEKKKYTGHDLQEDYNNYSFTNFVTEFLDVFEKNDKNIQILNNLEQECIKEYKNKNSLYNTIIFDKGDKKIKKESNSKKNELLPKLSFEVQKDGEIHKCSNLSKVGSVVYGNNKPPHLYKTLSKAIKNEYEIMGYKIKAIVNKNVGY